MLKLKLQYFGHLMRRADIGKDTDAGKDSGQEEKGTTEHEMGLPTGAGSEGQLGQPQIHFHDQLPLPFSPTVSVMPGGRALYSMV